MWTGLFDRYRRVFPFYIMPPKNTIYKCVRWEAKTIELSIICNIHFRGKGYFNYLNLLQHFHSSFIFNITCVQGGLGFN